MLSHRVRPPRTRYYDTEAIKDVLSVVDVIERSRVPFDPVELERRCMACFLHGGSNSTALSIFDDDRAWYCHSCRSGGDVIDLIAQLKQLSKADAIRVAALLAGIEAGFPPDPTIVKERAAARARRAAAKAQAAVLRRDENVRVATEIWWDVLNKAWWSGSRAVACETYLRSRSLDAVVKLNNRMHVLCAQADGSPAVPIYTFERGDLLTENAIVNIASRHVAPAPGAPKVTVLAGHTTRGTFGQSAQLLRTWDGGPCRLVLVEGLADYLAGLLAFSNWWKDECNARYPGISVVLGAHSAHGLSKIVATLGDDHEIGPRLREIPILLVEHDDGPGGAGAIAARDVRSEAATRGIAVESFDLGGHKDLADWLAARRRGGGA